MSYSQYTQNPYDQGPAQEEGGYQQQNPYGQNDYEMQNYNNAPQAPLSQPAFLERVTWLQNEIGDLRQEVVEIGRLHASLLSGADDAAEDPLKQQYASIRTRNARIKSGLEELQKDFNSTTDGTKNLKQSRLQLLKDQFTKELKVYERQELDVQKRNADQISRQYRIVNPDATEAQVQEAVALGEPVFETALKSNRTHNAQSALNNVNSRRRELQRIEQTIQELSTLFSDIALLVEQQEPVIQVAENNAIETTQNMEKGIEQTEKAKVSAARARRLKWWCALVVLLIVLAVALGVGLGVGLVKNASS